MKYSHCCEDKEECEIDSYSSVKVGEVEPAGNMANYVRNNGGQVLCEEGTQQVPMELEAGHNKMMAICATSSLAKLDAFKTIIQHSVRSCRYYVPWHNSE